MNWLDYAVFGVFGISLAVGAWRGLVHEIVSLLGWVIAFLAANLLAGPLGEGMPQTIPTPELRVAAAFIAIFLVSLIVTTLLALLLSKLVKAVGLGGLDRMLGMLFGAARGLIIVAAAALLAGMTSAPRQAIWRESLTSPWLAQAALALKPLLPQSLAERLRYD